MATKVWLRLAWGILAALACSAGALLYANRANFSSLAPTIVAHNYISSTESEELAHWSVKRMTKREESDWEKRDKATEESYFAQAFTKADMHKRIALISALRKTYVKKVDVGFRDRLSSPQSENDHFRMLDELDRSFEKLMQAVVLHLEGDSAIAYVSNYANDGVVAFLVDLGWDYPGYSRRVLCTLNSVADHADCRKIYSSLSGPLYVGRDSKVAALVGAFKIETLDLKSMKVLSESYKTDVQIDSFSFDPESSEFVFRNHDGYLMRGKTDENNKIIVVEKPVLRDTDASYIQNYTRILMNGSYIFPSDDGFLRCIDIYTGKSCWNINIGKHSFTDGTTDRTQGISAFQDSDEIFLVHSNGPISKAVIRISLLIKDGGDSYMCGKNESASCADRDIHLRGWNLAEIGIGTGGDLEIVVCSQQLIGNLSTCWTATRRL